MNRERASQQAIREYMDPIRILAVNWHWPSGRAQLQLIVSLTLHSSKGSSCPGKDPQHGTIDGLVHQDSRVGQPLGPLQRS